MSMTWKIQRLDEYDGHGGPGWEEVPYSELYSHYYMLEWRNDDGSIASHGLTPELLQPGP